MRFIKPYVLLVIAGIFLILGSFFCAAGNSNETRHSHEFNENQPFSFSLAQDNVVQLNETSCNTFEFSILCFDLANLHCLTSERQRLRHVLYVYFSFFSERLNRCTDVVAVTPWLAPIVWEGTFDAVLIDNIYKPMNLTVATTVFAVGKYVRFLQDFLETAEKHFMVGFHVRYYVFTDRPHDVPSVNLSQGRHLSVIQVPGSNRWQEISAQRMEIIQTTIERQIRGEADYIFCLDVDSKFHAHWGSESLGRLVAVIHPGYYEQTRDRFPYERRPASTAYIPMDEGDYYYGGAMIGGFVEDVYTLAKVCRTRFEEDAGNSIEAAWQEESHLNRYLLDNKPSKVLSPEYLWQDFKAKTKEVKVIRFSGVIKNYADVRPNV